MRRNISQGCFLLILQVNRLEQAQETEYGDPYVATNLLETLVYLLSRANSFSLRVAVGINQ